MSTARVSLPTATAGPPRHGPEETYTSEVTATTARERLTAFLVAQPGRNFCDACVAKALGIDPSTAYRAATRTARVAGFLREFALCTDCGASRFVTRATLL